MIKFNFPGQINFAKDEYVSVKIKKPGYKEKVRDVAVGAGLGGGLGHLLARKAGGFKQLGATTLGAGIVGAASYRSHKVGLFAKKDKDGRSDKGKKK